MGLLTLVLVKFLVLFLKAIVMTSTGGVDVLVEKDIDVPKVSSEDVLLKVVGCAICYRDTLARRGFARLRLPVIPGHAIAGRVVEVGDGVLEEFKRNDLVVSLPYVYDTRDPRCVEGEENICRSKMQIGEERDGCYAEYISLPYWVLVKVSDSGQVPEEAYSLASCPLGPPIRALKTIAKAQKGETVLVTGASGGIGLHAVQIAKAYGLKVIATTRSEEKAEKIRRVSNPDHIIVHKGKFSEEVKKLTDGEGADYAIEAVGGPTLMETIRALKWGGKVLLIGNIDPSPQQVMLGLIIIRENSIIGVLNCNKEELREAVELLRKGLVKPIYTTIPLDQDHVRKAHQTLEKGESFGRIVIKPG
jgi:acryloyl-coenzyme A reductase